MATESSTSTLLTSGEVARLLGVSRERVVQLDASLDPQRTVADRRWVDVDLPLDRWAGRTVALEVAVMGERPEGETLEMAGFEVPRLVGGGS